VSVWEAAIAVARIKKSSRSHALQEVEDFLRLSSLEMGEPNEDITRLAVDASERYGFGNAQGYPGILNMGDTFSYATARYFSAKLVCKGEDFRRTDIEIA
jgi:ribonuclease VapC